jgi:hypothetical protein
MGNETGETQTLPPFPLGHGTRHLKRAKLSGPSIFEPHRTPALARSLRLRNNLKARLSPWGAGVEIAFLWFAFAVVVGVAASARGRNGAGWFILALFISPLIALLLVLVMGRQESEAAPALAAQPFEPDGIHAGIPYRVMHDGSINAIIQGATVRFADHAKFSAATGIPLLRAAVPTPPLPKEQKLATLVDLRTPGVRKSWTERVSTEFSLDGCLPVVLLSVGAIVVFVIAH